MARVIDAEKYMELLKEQYLHHKSLGNSQAEKAWQGAIQLLYEMPTLTPPNVWVSVKNALPPEHELVLCIVSGNPNPNITLEDAYQLGSWNKADGWIIDEWLDWEGANVTWWMKLPEPPDRRPPEDAL